MAAGEAAGRAKENGVPVRMFPECFEDDGTLSFQEFIPAEVIKPFSAHKGDDWIQYRDMLKKDGTTFDIKPEEVLALKHDDDDLEPDSWRQSKNHSKLQIFRNVENYVLIVKPESPENQMAAFEDIPTPDRNDESGIRFTIHGYDDTVPRARTVALTTSKGNKTYCLCAKRQANGEMRVAFQERNLPDRISGEASDIIFFQIPFSEGDNKFFKFESTLERGYFLAFERHEGNHSRRLIMKRVLAKDEVDETIKLFPSSD